LKEAKAPSPQEEKGATRAYKLSKEEGLIDWNSDAEAINRKINAFNPDPGAWSNFRGQIIKINKVRVSNESAIAGVLKAVEKSIYIGTGNFGAGTFRSNAGRQSANVGNLMG
jgi:methionyl-tRNA formyltransferase